jgi:alanine racemase
VSHCKVGDDAVLIGRQGREHVAVDELAHLCGTISYETVTSLSSRVPRVGVHS